MSRERSELWHDQEKYALNAVAGCFFGLDMSVLTVSRDDDEPGRR